MGWEIEAGINGPKMRLLFSLVKEICRRRLWKGASLSLGSSDGGMWRGGSFIGDFERQVLEASLSKRAMQGESRCIYFMHDICNLISVLTSSISDGS
jgi:hypothetical protein